MALRGLICFVLLLGAVSVFAQIPEYEVKYGQLLERFVRDGKVDYAGLSASRAQVEECMQAFADISKREFETWLIPQRLAYLINYYNCTVLSIGTEHYPLASIRNAGGWFSGDPFAWRSLKLFRHPISLNLLLANYILRDYAEPGALLAITQGAAGSPPLRAEPYTADRLYEQFADQARIFLQTPPNKIDRDQKRMYLPELFRDYSSYFARKSGTVEAYIREISPEEWGLRDVPGRFSVSYNKFDWRLNDMGPLSK